MPALGLGTWKSADDAAYRAVKHALAVGYRHIDCAWIYLNEEQVGRAVRESLTEGVLTREELFVTSKLWNSFHDPADVEPGCRESLAKLGLDYVDLYLMHWPMAYPRSVMMPESREDFVPLSELPLATTWHAMARLVDAGLARAIGVSNFSVSKIRGLLDAGGPLPAVNQVELHPYNPQPELLAGCAELGVHVTAYSPLGSADRPDMMRGSDDPILLEHPVVRETAAAEGITPAQLLIAWALARGTSVIPKSENPKRIEENFAAAEIELSAGARAALDGIEQRFRYVNPEGMFIPGVTYEGESFWA
jgi:alcohol dehydrogenase (NADP+)